MGNITSRPDDISNVYLKDQSRLSIKSLVVSNGRKKVVLNLHPNGYPATRLLAKRDVGDDAPISYIQDADSSTAALLLRLDLEDELDFRFTFISRQAAAASAAPSATTPNQNIDTNINGLTFAYASSPKELDTLVTREFHADPNLHKNSNVQFIGDFATEGSPAIEYEWSWQWRPPKASEDRGGGWRNHCSFLEYDSRAHRLNTLASFGYWVNNAIPPVRSPVVTSPYLELAVPPSRHRVPSSQSYQSTVSDSEGPNDTMPLASRSLLTSTVEPVASASLSDPQLLAATEPPVVDVSCQRPGEDMSNVEDGPVFRATMKSLEQKTGSMRVQIKKVLKRAEAAHQAQVECNETMRAFLGALQEASGSNASAFKPALEHYFTKIAQRILNYEADNGELLRKQIIEPLSKLYNLDIKQADAKRKDFEDESRDYYQYVSRYLGQRQDSLKEKKRAESDSKYQTKKKTFELARFDYSSFMQDLHGGRKEQELLSQLTKYADGQAKSFLAAAQKVESLQPQLDALVRGVREADKEYRLQRTEREEKRRNLELNATTPGPPESDTIPHVVSTPSVTAQSNGHGGYTSDTDLSRADSTSSQFTSAGRTLSPSNSVQHGQGYSVGGTLVSTSSTVVSTANKFRGIRDLEERDLNGSGADKAGVIQHRKEGLLWALSKPGSHLDPKGINKQAWHKFWIVLDQGKLSEYSNWKDRLDLHRDPIDLRMASVRMARDAERRFCFEVITPQYKRVYQATTEEEMMHWINAINNALQSAFEGRGNAPSTLSSRSESSRNEYGAVLTGKPASQSGSAPRADAQGVTRSSTVGSRPAYIRTTASAVDDNPTQLLDLLRANDQGNQFCADCGSNSRVEWTSINLGIILCIECGGIHRSLGTHVSKVRSLTLDVKSFTADIVEVLMLIGNRISNMVWEANLEQRLKPEPWANREARLKFISAKYVDRAFVDFGSTQAHFPVADDNLLTSIKKNDIQGVLSAIAQRANVNSHDRSRNTHAVFLALAAADPAYPTPSAPFLLTSPTASLPTAATDGPIKAFPIAELLVQNGSEIPLQLPAIPLSPAAHLYIDQRTTRSFNLAGGDTLGPLPTMSMSSGRPGGDGKLQKRGSAGARFAGKVTGLAER